jgi:hypothetical protein
MLPDGVYPISNIQREEKIGNKLLNCGATLEYVLTLIDPNTKSSDDVIVGLGQKILRNKQLFSKYEDVLFAIGVRNYFAHPGGRNKEYTEAEKKRASKHLIRAIQEISNHPAVPAQIRHEILQDSYQGQPSINKVKRIKPNKVKSASTQTDYQQYSIPKYQSQWITLIPGPRRVGKFILLLVLLAIIYTLIVKVSPLLTSVGSMFTRVSSTETAYVNTF